MIGARQSEVVYTGPNGEPLIRKTPDVCGGDACIGNWRIMVWLLISRMKRGATDDKLLAGYPGLTLQDLDAARAYYRLHPEEIEKAIAENEHDDDE